MFSKEEAKELTTLFWTSFGKYMNKHKPQYAKNIKWVNYKTGVKDIFFRLNADKNSASVSIEIQHEDAFIRSLFFEQFEELQTLFKGIVGEWTWEKETFNNMGIPSSKIFINHQQKVNIYLKDTWADCFKFFELNMVKLDEFWSEFNEIFKNLSD